MYPQITTVGRPLLGWAELFQLIAKTVSFNISYNCFEENERVCFISVDPRDHIWADRINRWLERPGDSLWKEAENKKIIAELMIEHRKRELSDLQFTEPLLEIIVQVEVDKYISDHMRYCYDTTDDHSNNSNESIIGIGFFIELYDDIEHTFPDVPYFCLDDPFLLMHNWDLDYTNVNLDVDRWNLKVFNKEDSSELKIEYYDDLGMHYLECFAACCNNPKFISEEQILKHFGWQKRLTKAGRLSGPIGLTVFDGENCRKKHLKKLSKK